MNGVYYEKNSQLMWINKHEFFNFLLNIYIFDERGFRKFKLSFMSEIIHSGY